MKCLTNNYYLSKNFSFFFQVKFKINVDYNEPQPAQVASGRRQYDKEAARIRNDYLLNLNKENLRIRGGNATDTKNFPYIAAIIINGRLWCAGTIVDVNWVLTAAHCLN